MADKDHRSGCNTEEYKVVVAHFADIANAIQDSTHLTKQLLQAQLINTEDYSKSADGVSKLLNHVLCQIELSVDNFYIFTEVLAAEKDTMPLVSKLLCSIELSQLLQKYSMNIEDIDQVCSDHDNFFLEISLKSDKCIEVGHHLFVPEDKMETITRQREGDSERIIAVLLTWKQTMENNATYLVLVRAFLEMRNKSVAESIMKYAKDDIMIARSSKVSQINPAKRIDNWDKMSCGEKERVRVDLIEENRRVHEAFLFLLLNLYKSFMNRDVQPTDVQLIVQFCGIPEEYTYPFKFCEDDDMITVFVALSKHSSWFNFELISFLLDKIGTQEEKNIFQEYHQKILFPYLQRCIFEIPPQSFGQGSFQLQRACLFLKVVELILITGLEVKAIQHNLADMLGLNRCFFHFDLYQERSRELFFAVHSAIFNQLSLIYLEWDPSKEAYRVTADLVTILSYSRSPEVLILSKILKLKPVVSLTDGWAIICSNVAKATKNITLNLKTDPRSNFSPRYYEEPYLNLGSNHNEYDVVTSGLCLTCEQRMSLVKKCHQKGISLQKEVKRDDNGHCFLKDIGLIFSGHAKPMSSDQSLWLVEEFIKMKMQRKYLAEEDSQRQESLLFEKMNRGLVAEADNLKQELREKNKLISDQEQRLKEERQQFEMRKKSELAAFDERKTKLEKERDIFEKEKDTELKKLELRKEQILSDFNSKSETLELERQEIENERQKFEATKIEEDLVSSGHSDD